MIDLGVCSSEAEGRERLKDAFVGFLRAGGVLAWADWEEMSDDEREAAESAGEQVSGERAVTQAYALFELQREGVETTRISRALDATARRLESTEVRGRR